MKKTVSSPLLARAALAGALMTLCASAAAQTQVVKPPISQYWMDIATMSMAGMDEMPSLGGMGGGLLGNLPGMGGMGGNSFGKTRSMSPGRWLDIAVVTQRKPGGTEATQTIPPGQNMGANLTLLPVQPQPRSTSQTDDEPEELPERPKGRLLFYWGCSETVRAGQPRILDFATTPPEEFGKFMRGRSVRDRGARARPGHAIWPNEKNRQNVPKEASLQGQHAVTGEGLPPDLQFALGQQQDFMPPLRLSGSGGGASATQISWPALPTARAYFLSAMSGSENEMIIWSSSDVPEPGWGLMDYISNSNIDKWLTDKVLLPTSQTQCAIPAGIFAKAQHPMVRGIAYGNELNLAHPPRPTDKRIPWEPDWAVRVRVKSVAMLPLGSESPAAPRGRRADTAAPPPPQQPAEPAAAKEEEKTGPGGLPGLPDVGRALKGIFGR